MSRSKVVDFASAAEPFPAVPPAVDPAQLSMWHWPHRTQDHVARGPVDNPVVACTPEEDRARQEYGVSSQIQYQIQRFGINHPLVSGEADFELMDLTVAMQKIEAANAAWLELPKVVRDRYHSWAAVEHAAKSGELDDLLKGAGVPAGSSGGAPAPSASDSAPVPPANAG